VLARAKLSAILRSRARFRAAVHSRTRPVGIVKLAAGGSGVGRAGVERRDEAQP
jgi:hypothetical protein